MCSTPNAILIVIAITAGSEEQEGGRREEKWAGRGSRGGESMAPGPNGGAQGAGLGRAGALQQQQQRMTHNTGRDSTMQIKMRWAVMR
jgi:hypothetical protein